MTKSVTEIFQAVKNTIICTNPPASRESKDCDYAELDGLLLFGQAIANIIFVQEENEYCKAFWKEDKGTEGELYGILYRVFRALLTEIYKVGRCDEFASLSLACLLKSGINKSIELIHTRGKGTESEPCGHLFVILDRDSSSDINDPETWKNIKKFDTWADEDIEEYGEDTGPTLDSLKGEYFSSIDKIGLTLRFTRNLSSEDCHFLIIQLKLLRRLITLPLLELACEQSQYEFNELEEQLSLIHQKIDEEIVCFRSLKTYSPLQQLKTSSSVLHLEGMYKEKNPAGMQDKSKNNDLQRANSTVISLCEQ